MVDIPEWIKVGDATYKYYDCNPYQKAIYIELSRHLKARQALDDNKIEIAKKDGVIEYLYQKLDMYGRLKTVKNMYDAEEITPNV